MGGHGGWVGGGVPQALRWGIFRYVARKAVPFGSSGYALCSQNPWPERPGVDVDYPFYSKRIE